MRVVRFEAPVTSDKGMAVTPSRVVIRGTNWVGDTVMSLPAARELRRIFQSSIISYWGPRGLIPLVKASGVADEFISFGPEAGGPLKRPFRMGRNLAEGRFDMAVLFQNAFESAFTAWLARIPSRAGFPTDLRGPLLNVKIPLTRDIRSKHQVFYYLAISDYIETRFSGACRDRMALPDCSVNLADSDVSRAKDLLAAEDIDSRRPFLALCPGSVNSEAKRWPADCFAGLADLIVGVHGAQVVFLGAPGEAGLVRDIISMMTRGSAANFAGKSGMIESMAIMSMSDMVISNDTGSAHLAVAASAEVLTIFGPTVPGATAPYGPGAHVIQGEAPCAPCRHFRCPKPGHPCMRDLSPDAVFAKITELTAARRN